MKINYCDWESQVTEKRVLNFRWDDDKGRYNKFHNAQWGICLPFFSVNFIKKAFLSCAQFEWMIKVIMYTVFHIIQNYINLKIQKQKSGLVELPFLPPFKLRHIILGIFFNLKCWFKGPELTLGLPDQYKLYTDVFYRFINRKKDVDVWGVIVFDYGRRYMLFALVIKTKSPTVPFMYLKFLFPYLYLLLY